MPKTRRRSSSNSWAKCAGEYYRKHKHDKDISSFSDVLKSKKFKEYYHSKNGKHSKKRGGDGDDSDGKSSNEESDQKNPVDSESSLFGGKSRKRKTSKRRSRRHR
jgi:hypothetical protein|uniref:Uncharacterized protein n=1 Tax=viral metagenome TaxID=1070528 RepID=A0A6C0DWX3_9ZZZZ